MLRHLFTTQGSSMFIMRRSYEQRLRAVNDAMKVGYPQTLVAVTISRDDGDLLALTFTRPWA